MGGFDPKLFEKLTAEPGQDQRRHPRIAKSGRVAIYVSYQRQPLMVLLRDISAGGIGFSYMQPMELGTTFTLEVPTDGATKTLRYKVVRCIARERHQFDIGAQLLRVKRNGASN